MGSKLICILAVVMMVAGLAVPAAAQSVGEIRVTLDFGDGEVHDGSVIFRLAARPEGEHYRLLDAFGGGIIRREDMVSDALALWLAETVRREETARILDADGSACFTNLEEGLYLLVQGEEIQWMDPFEPILIPMPSNGQWQLSAWPQQRLILAQCPQTGQPITLLLAAMGLIFSSMGLIACYEKIRRK